MLVLSINFLDEEMPADMNLQFKNLKGLVLANCKLRGSIPRWLSGCKPVSIFQLYKGVQGGRGLMYKQISALQPTLDLSYNMLQVSIWPSFENLRRLHVFILKDNNLSGPIPDNLSRMSSL
ncbi:hypothetical protein FH972_005678 [Carpinus fangiana]|uniref:Leucine-rich repeat-containing N-terminal plant-type domain-containing protein n=1 Tax=Carpinus fangiana TaxID=176857 RepID=A0A5N6QT87_9ROSI|nr:hypothetical protein FH972_005678 [Carpinus fangiana]